MSEYKGKILALSWRDIKSPKSGGAEVHSHELYKCLIAAGYQVVSFTPMFDGAEDENIDGVIYHREGGILSVIGKARKYYKRNREEFAYVIDQCNTHRFFTKFWVEDSKRIFYIHQLTREIWDINAGFPLNVIGKLSESWMLRLNRKDYVITVSESTKRELVELGFCADKIFLVYNGLSERLFDHFKKYQKEEAPTFIYVGRYVKYKGINVAVEAVGKLKKQGFKSKLWIVGKKDEAYVKEELLPICDRYGLIYGDGIKDGQDISFAGFVSGEEKMELQGRAHALVFPSVREGWGIIVSEAACMGTPSIVYNSPGARDAVDLGNAGYLCKENSVDEVARLMRKVIEEPELYESMQEKAFAYTTQFTWEKNQVLVKQMMAKISGEHKKPDNYRRLERKRKWINRLLLLMDETRLVGMKYAGGRLHSAQEGNQWIKEALLSGRPFMAGRFGLTEMNPVIMRERNFGSEEERAEADKHICIDSGFFPCESEAIDRYRTVFLEAIPSMDLMGIYFFINNEEYMIEKFMDRPYCTLPRALEPFYYEEPWSKALEGKRVLVIHPFADTIKRQYEKREVLFQNPDILPEFHLETIKAVQTLADQRDDRFQDWFEALAWMKSQIDAVDFDVALLGCGAYGIPLQSYIKSMGKQSVYVGGGLQILFGIKGKRWDSHPIISGLYNEHWVRPGETEKFKNYQSVEIGGPYW